MKIRSRLTAAALCSAAAMSAGLNCDLSEYQPSELLCAIHPPGQFLSSVLVNNFDARRRIRSSSGSVSILDSGAGFFAGALAGIEFTSATSLAQTSRPA